jgi:Uma2 family endonuclease
MDMVGEGQVPKLFDIHPKEEEILIDHAEGGIHRRRNGLSAKSLNWSRRRRRRRRRTFVSCKM